MESDKKFEYQAQIFDILSDQTRLWILNQATEGPVAAPDLATDRNVSPESMHYHLEKLEQAGFLESSTVRGPGNRPRDEYRLTGSGKIVRLEVIPDDYDFELREPNLRSDHC